MKTLYSFDFDDTLVFTPTKEEGSKIWTDKTDTPWPYVGWWSKQETIDPDIFYIPKNELTYGKYLDACADDDSVKICATGRLNKVPGMRRNVGKILRQHNYEFDEIDIIPGNAKYPENGKEGVYLNWSGDTYNFKTRLFEQLIAKTKCDRFIMYDDRYDHIKKFYEWAETKDIEIIVFDVRRKVVKTFNKKEV